MSMDYIGVINNFVETVRTPILVIDDRSYVISSNKAGLALPVLILLKAEESELRDFSIR